MIALLINNGRVVGYHPDVSAAAQSGHDYIEVESLPPEYENLQENQILLYDNGVFTVEQLPPPEPSEVEMLRQENAQLNISIIEIWESIIPLLPE